MTRKFLEALDDARAWMDERGIVWTVVEASSATIKALRAEHATGATGQRDGVPYMGFTPSRNDALPFGNVRLMATGSRHDRAQEFELVGGVARPVDSQHAALDLLADMLGRHNWSRIGQMISNALPRGRDPFHISDTEMLDALRLLDASLGGNKSA